MFNQRLTDKFSFSEAIDCYNKALEIDPTDTLLFINKGISLNYLCNTNEAISSFNRALELNPYESTALTHKGIAISKFGAHSEALDYIDKALQINPYDYAALVWKGNYLEMQKDDLYAAIRYYGEALKINPQDHIIKAKIRIIGRKILEREFQESY